MFYFLIYYLLLAQIFFNIYVVSKIIQQYLFVNSYYLQLYFIKINLMKI